MAWTPTPIKLLNSDGSFMRWSYPSEMRDLLQSKRVIQMKHRSMILLRLKELPPASDSAPSPCMPTLNDLLSYVGLQKCTDEQRAKIDMCGPQFKVTYEEVAACA
jgi:hypothetical protein